MPGDSLAGCLSGTNEASGTKVAEEEEEVLPPQWNGGREPGRDSGTVARVWDGPD